jgi:hypothetical protein
MTATQGPVVRMPPARLSVDPCFEPVIRLPLPSSRQRIRVVELLATGSSGGAQEHVYNLVTRLDRDWVRLRNPATLSAICLGLLSISLTVGAFGLSVVQTVTPLERHEHRILRPIWRDPRIHYALSCAAAGCPNLQPEPFEADRIERQLNQAAIAYINDPRCIQTADDQLVVSSIYRWYQDDFGGSDRAVINHLMAYAEPGLAMSLQRFEQIAGDRFEWRLNDATP